MTRKEIETQCTLNMNDNRTNTVTQIHNALDIVLRYMVTKLNISSHIRDGYLRTTSGRMQYGLPSDVRQLQGRFYIPESDEWLEDIDPDTFNERYPSPDSTDIPYVSMLQERWPVIQQPHSILRGDSDSASDTQDVTIMGFSFGRYLSETITLTGTTAVITTNVFQKVFRVTASSAAVGTITLTGSSTSGDYTRPTVAAPGAVTICTISAGDVEPANILNPGAILRIKTDAWDAGDTTDDRNQTITIEGLIGDFTNRIDAIEHSETITTDASDATTEVQTLNKWYEVHRITKAWDSFNTVLVNSDSMGVLLAAIGPNTRAVEHQQVRFYNVPDGKTILYRYTPNYTKVSNDGDDISDVVPEVYHQVVTEWVEKLVRGWHGDGKLGVATLENNAAFDRAIREIKQSSRPATTDHIKVGSDWQHDQRRSLVWPIVHSSN